MSKALIVARREYLTRVMKKSFLILTLLVPVLMSLLMFLPLLMMKWQTGNQKLAVLDESGILTQKLSNTDNLEFEYFTRVSLDSLKTNYKEMGFDGVLYIPLMEVDRRPSGITFYSDKQPGMYIRGYIEDALSSQIKNLRIQKLGKITQQELDDLDVNVRLTSRIIGDKGEREGNSAVAAILSQIMGFILYFILFMYGGMIMKGVVEEKTNRIVEVMVSSARPRDLMMGKILGIAGVALTQLLVWMIFLMVLGSLGFAIFMPHMADMSAQTLSAQLSSDPGSFTKVEKMVVGLQTANYGLLLPCFVFFFLFGYLMYAAMFAAVGSITDEQENQALTLPITIPVILAMIIMVQVVNQPDSPLALWSSLFPLFSPIVMIARLPFGVPAWQLITSMVLLFLGFLVAVWLSGRIYRTGILLYGKKVTFKEIWKWLFIKE